jgi:predicted GIY-YIG superfamily endonuclease
LSTLAERIKELNWWVYLLKCTAKTGRVTIHVGIAIDTERRLEQHRNGEVKATRGREIEFLGAAGLFTKGEALSLEAQMKRLPREEKTVAWLSLKAQEVHLARRERDAEPSTT